MRFSVVKSTRLSRDMSACSRIGSASRDAVTGRDVGIHHFPEPGFGGTREDGAWSLHVHRSLDALETLEPAWRRLTSADGAPFQTYSWNLAWYRCFASGEGIPLIFETRKNGVTAAILPCYFEGRSIRLAGDQTGGRQDVIALENEAVDAALNLSMGWLKGEAKRSDFHFEKLSREGLLFRSLQQSVGSRGETLKFEEVRSFIQTVALKGGFEGFLVAQSRESQQDLREVMIRLEREAPAARVVKLRDFQVRVDDLANAAAFHIEHFRKRGVSPFLDQRLFHFLGEIAKDPDVGFQLSCLTNQGDILAVDFGFLRAGRYYSYLAASDETFARLEPGKCLLVKRINSWSKVDGVHALEFPVGDDGYPEGLFADSVCEVRSIRLMPRDLRNRARHLRLESNQQVRRFARSALEKTAILPR